LAPFIAMIPSDERDQQPWWRRGHRSALFPLIVIVLLVYLAAQTLLPSDDGTDEVTYRDAKRLIRETPEAIELATFRPTGRVLELTMEDGRELETNYPSDASAVVLEELLDDGGVQYDSAGSGESAWWSILTYLLPFVLFFGFWIFLMNRARDRGRGHRSGDSVAERDVDPS
jgi:cell division protease FtsH